MVLGSLILAEGMPVVARLAASHRQPRLDTTTSSSSPALSSSSPGDRVDRPPPGPRRRPRGPRDPAPAHPRGRAPPGAGLGRRPRPLGGPLRPRADARGRRPDDGRLHRPGGAPRRGPGRRRRVRLGLQPPGARRPPRGARPGHPREDAGGDRRANKALLIGSGHSLVFLLLVQVAFFFVAGVSPAMGLFGSVWIVVLAAVLLDVVYDWRFRARHGKVVAVRPLHRLYAVDPALEALDTAGIPALAGGGPPNPPPGARPLCPGHDPRPRTSPPTPPRSSSWSSTATEPLPR